MRAPSALGCGQHPPRGCAAGRERWPFSLMASQDYSEAEQGACGRCPLAALGAEGGRPRTGRHSDRAGLSCDRGPLLGKWRPRLH